MSAKVELCRDKITLSEPVVLGIHSNVAGDENSYTSGHSWVSVSSNDKMYYFGLWPDGHPRVVNTRADCTDVRVGFEAGAPPKVSRYYSLNSAQVIKLNEFINRPDVWAYRNNCTNWAVTLLKEVVGVNISAVDYVLFSTPRELGSELAKLEKQHPTSQLNPQRGRPAEAGSSWFGGKI